MKLVETLVRTMRKNHIRANNIMLSPDWSVCFNFLNIPNTRIAAMTATLMKNHSKKAKMDDKGSDFRESMLVVEDRLAEAKKEYISTTSLPEGEHLDCSQYLTYRDEMYDLFDPTWEWIKPTGCYNQLNVHRCYFVPENSVRIIIRHMITNGMLSKLWNLNINEVSFVIPKLPDGSMPAANRICGEFFMSTFE